MQSAFSDSIYHIYHSSLKIIADSCSSLLAKGFIFILVGRVEASLVNNRRKRSKKIKCLPLLSPSVCVCMCTRLMVTLRWCWSQGAYDSITCAGRSGDRVAEPPLFAYVSVRRYHRHNGIVLYGWLQWGTQPNHFKRLPLLLLPRPPCPCSPIRLSCGHLYVMLDRPWQRRGRSDAIHFDKVVHAASRRCFLPTQQHRQRQRTKESTRPLFMKLSGDWGENIW